MNERIRRIPPKRHAVTGRLLAAHRQPKILSSEEKRELIHAHAAARHGRPSAYGLGFYVAVGASFLVVLTGWWLTLDANLERGENGQSDALVSGLTQSFSDFSSDIEQTKAAVESAKKIFEEAKVNN